MVKTLIIVSNDDDDCKYIQFLHLDPKEEALYAEFQSFDDNKKITYDTLELAVNVEQIIKIRDWITKQINKIAKNKIMHPDNFDYYGNVINIGGLKR